MAYELRTDWLRVLLVSVIDIFLTYLFVDISPCSQLISPHHCCLIVVLVSGPRYRYTLFIRLFFKFVSDLVNVVAFELWSG